MRTVFPNYQESLVSVANSILKYFDCETSHETLPELDAELKKGKYKNVVLLLYDGMGYQILRRNLDRNTFLNRHLKKSISSVLPPTTTAATTSVLTGLTPKEHGWLGWDLYFKDIDQTVTMFLNTKKDTDIPVSKESVAYKYYPYKSIIERIHEKEKAYSITPFGENPYTSLEEMYERIENYCKEDGKKFIYAYSEEPDTTMHQFGTDCKRTRNLFQKLNDDTATLCKKLTDTLVIVVADHGHINSEPITLSEYPDIFSLLRQDISIESRCCAFFIKEGKEKEFEALFQKYFGNDFLLYSKEKVLEENLFGIGKEHEKLRSSLGDYLALAIHNKYFRYNENSVNLISMHAGITDEEVFVPLILYKAK